MKILLSAIYYLFVLGIVAISILLLISFIPVGGMKVKVVKSGSMEPSIKTGSIVLIKPSLSYKLNDVVTFGADTKTQVPTTHRIVSVTGEGNRKFFTTKGDANDGEDPVQVRDRDIIGKVILDIPYAGFLLDFAKRPIGFALLVGLPALSIIIDEIMSIVAEVKRIRRKKMNESLSSDIQ